MTAHPASGSHPEPPRCLLDGPGDHLLGGIDYLGFGGEPERRVIAQPLQDGVEIGLVDGALSDLGVLVGQLLGGDLGPDPVYLLGRRGQRGEHRCQAPVGVVTPLEVGDTGALGGAGCGEDLVGDHLPVACEPGPDDISHQFSNPGSPAISTIPVAGQRRLGERVRFHG